MSDKYKFDELLKQRLIPEFCSLPKRCITESGYIPETNYVTERDATDFLRAWDAGFAAHKDHGRYYICETRILDQFFWERGKAIPGRKFSLWMEPVITMAALARLHFVYEWPRSSLLNQPDNWAFDLMTKGLDGKTVIAGEVKKSVREIENLVAYMQTFGASPELPEPAAGPARNAFRKVAALRTHPAPLFWAIGPDGYEQIFRVDNSQAPVLRFIPVTSKSLCAPKDLRTGRTTVNASPKCPDHRQPSGQSLPHQSLS